MLNHKGKMYLLLLRLSLYRIATSMLQHARTTTTKEEETTKYFTLLCATFKFQVYSTVMNAPDKKTCFEERFVGKYVLDSPLLLSQGNFFEKKIFQYWSIQSHWFKRAHLFSSPSILLMMMSRCRSFLFFIRMLLIGSIMWLKSHENKNFLGS